MFTFESGRAYIGKGEEGRMNESISTRTKQDIAEGGNGKIIGQAHISTDGNNELGKMVEFKAMENAGFKGGTDVPSNYMNAWRSGETAWNDKKNAHLREKASKLADELKRKHDSDLTERRKKTSY